MKKIVFSFEASSTRGAGHAIRCSAIASVFKKHNWHCIFVTSQDSFNYIKELQSFERIDPPHFLKNPFDHDILVVDNYELDSTYENAFRTKAKTILVLDDLANRAHACDFLIDQSLEREPNDYKKFLSQNTPVLTGPDFAAIRDEFILFRPFALQKRRNQKQVDRILISMGGSDPNNYTQKALKEIFDTSYKGAIEIVLGFHATNKETIEKFCQSHENQITFHTQPNMAKLMYEADLSIGAAGTSVWERCCLGLPMFLYMTADNQQKNIDTLIKNKIAHPLSHLKNVIENYSFQENLARSVDGLGKNRIYQLLTAQNSDLKFTPVTSNDRELIFNWQNIPGIRKHFIHPQVPTREEHNAWFEKRLQQTENPYWIIEAKGKAVGTMSLTFDAKHNYYDIGWYLLPEVQGKGYGAQSIKMACELMQPHTLHAFVKNENIASHKSFLKNNFQKIDDNNYIFKN